MRCIQKSPLKKRKKENLRRGFLSACKTTTIARILNSQLWAIINNAKPKKKPENILLVDDVSIFLLPQTHEKKKTKKNT